MVEGLKPTAYPKLTESMAELTEHQKLEIVTMLACFRKPAAILTYFGDTYGLELQHRQVSAYDPTNPHYDAGEKWCDIFDAKRKAYLEEVASVPIANQGFRLNILNELAIKAIEDDKPALAAALLEQAAKETGGLLTNMRELKVDDSRRLRPSEMTPEDRRLALADLIRQALDQREPGQPGAMTQ